MLRKIFVAFAAGAAMTLTSPGLAAQQGSGGIWAKRVNSLAKAKARAKAAEERAKKKEQARSNSEGADHASATGTANASEHSVHADGAVDGSALPGLTTGLSVRDSSGTALGTVSQVVTGSDGSIRQVIVTAPSGETLRLMPDQLSVSGGVVTTSQTEFGG